MGVLTDYFRAADAACVVRALERTSGGPLVGVSDRAFDGVDAKGVDSAVVLGKLIAAVKQVPWEVHLVKETMVWPTTPVPGPEGPVDEDDPWVTGPWVTALDNMVRDALAESDDTDLGRAVAEWARAEELAGASVEDLRPLAEELIRLARRAHDHGEQLYCWVCL